MLKVVADVVSRAELAASLDEIVREGARRMLAAALEAEVEAHLAAFAGERDEDGRRLVVRNGHARPRQVSTVAGAIEVSAPRVDDRRIDEVTGERRRFRSALLPPWCRRFAEGDRGVATAVSAWLVQPGLRAGVGGVLRQQRGIVRVGDHPPDH
jgi:putative transposase